MSGRSLLPAQSAPWIGAFVLATAAPHLFGSNSAITIMNQMSITIVFALSYNMLLGQAGMLSFGHAVYMGLGGFACLHVMNYAQAESLPLPLPLLPLVAGGFSLGVATIVGALSTRRAGTPFAMISLGIVELVASSAIILSVFFQGGGAGGDRAGGPEVFGVDFAQQIEVYHLVIAWTAIAVLAMYLFTRTPLGRMANAVRDNAERAEFLGYSAALVRLYSFSIAGFFAGVAGGLFAITYEIATVENLSVEASGTILMVAFLGGVGSFIGPVLGAVVFTLLQTVLSLETDLWRLYLGALFLATVMFFPGGLAGLLALHAKLARTGRAGRVVRPYLRTVSFAAVGALAVAALLEMLSHARQAAVGETLMRLFWLEIDSADPFVRAVFALLAIAGFLAARRSAPTLAAAWRGADPEEERR